MTEELGTIWMRPERPAGTVPGPQRTYSRSQITAAAIEIADSDGLEATSMRRIAARIKAGVMSLYHYVGNRDDLLELMVDAVAGEMTTAVTPDMDWRERITLFAREKRALWLRHPWLATRLAGHPVWGPNSLRHQEFLFSSLDGFGLPMEQLVSFTGLVNGYVESFVRTEVGWAEESRRTKVDMQEWIRQSGPHARAIVTSGEYPMFARMLLETDSPHMKPDERFQYGLDLVLDSMQASLTNR
ncbi:MAG: putative transcriptional regulator, TetR family [Amycolatopsis sp.]|uniref:TetR/AcrR family transcriptional regulator n=1 Tax=Amycolatopsis sp. TaxID=37632 RepID=UPI00260A1912|nr:TetR/AcrR family transcriptional regulator [Amycolatopsis sp.]MCU1681790.1 putative transcriptional regulator, TetR family [Amycolatopsis sp.]